MRAFEKFRNEVEELLEKTGVKDARLEKPPEGIDADLAFPCFGLAKEFRKNPVEIAKEISSKASSKIVPNGLVEEVKAAGPYANFYSDGKKMTALVIEEILREKDRYGSGNEKGKVLIDTFQPNPFKAFHIGHVRNAVLGESIRRALELDGKKVESCSFMGDVGTHVAKWMWYYLNFCEGKDGKGKFVIPKEDFGRWAGEIYAKASAKAKENPEYEEQVKALNLKLDNRDPETMKVWKRLREPCLDDFWKIQKELGVRLEASFMESECEAPGKKKVLEFYKAGKLKESQGAIVMDLEGQGNPGLGVFIMLKSDGTALYSTKDTGLLLLKKKKFKYDESLYVVASEQDFYFRQLLKTFEVLGLENPGKLKHVSYALVTLKEGKMASRLGNVILYEDLRDKAAEKVLEEINKRNPSLKNKEKVAKEVALGAIKFAMLDIDNNKQVKFDWDQVLDFEGRSGPYLQYTYARAESILRKAEGAGEKGKAKSKAKKYDASVLAEPQEKALARKLAGFPDSVHRAAQDYSPSAVANYLFELCQSFNTFYTSVQVIGSEQKALDARLALVRAAAQTIRNGLWVLGIGAPEEM